MKTVISKAVSTFGFVNYFLIMTLGNGLHYGIILFEHYGEDPLKRSIGNQMVSFICGVLIAHTVVTGSVFILYLLIGQVGVFFGTIYVMMRAAAGIAACLSFFEHIIYKCFFAFDYHHATNLNEDFVARFLKLLNIVITMWAVGVHARLEIMYGMVYSKISGDIEIPIPR